MSAAGMSQNQAFFKNKVRDAALSDLHAAFEKQGWRTCADFAFATHCSDGLPAEDGFWRDVLQPLLELKEDETVQRETSGKLRRLFFECWVLTMEETRKKTEKLLADNTAGAMERTHRKDEAETFLGPGVDMSDANCPSHDVIDKTLANAHAGELHWLPWDAVPSRSQERDACRAAKKVSSIMPKPQSMTDLQESVGLRRRGAVYHICGIVRYGVHEMMHNRWVAAVQEEPPAGCAPVSWAQVRRADQWLWAQVERALPKGWSPTTPGASAMPADSLVMQTLDHPRVQSMLMHLPRHAAAEADSPRERKRSSGDFAEPDPAKKIRALEAEVQRLRVIVTKGSKGKGKAIGGGKKGGSKGKLNGKQSKSDRADAKGRLHPLLSSLHHRFPRASPRHAKNTWSNTDKHARVPRECAPGLQSYPSRAKSYRAHAQVATATPTVRPLSAPSSQCRPFTSSKLSSKTRVDHPEGVLTQLQTPTTLATTRSHTQDGRAERRDARAAQKNTTTRLQSFRKLTTSGQRRPRLSTQGISLHCQGGA